VAQPNLNKMRTAIGGLLGAALLAVSLAAPAAAQDSGQVYQPTIWIDPDGCEHWVMDDGAEGFMTPNLQRNGDPVCHRAEICGVMPTDQLFATDRYEIDANGRATLENFFRSANAFGFMIYGHTDARASDEYNMTLSQNRANAVAAVAQGIGARVVDIRGFGERRPRADNTTVEGLQQNRRVEVYCLR